jgi:hypothetical protein
MSGGEISLSGTDDNGLALTYTAGEEQLFLNGTLLARGADYTATNGTTIVGIAALVSGDVIEVHSRTMQNIANTYTQSAADSRFVNRSVGGLNLVIPTGATNGTVSANGAVTIGNAVSSVTVNGAFSATYDAYKIVVSSGVGSTTANIMLRLGGSTASYSHGVSLITYSTAAIGGASEASGAQFAFIGAMNTSYLNVNCDLVNPFLAKQTYMSASYSGQSQGGNSSGVHQVATSYTDFTLLPSSGTLTGGTIRIYGYNNGA